MGVLARRCVPLSGSARSGSSCISFCHPYCSGRDSPDSGGECGAKAWPCGLDEGLTEHDCGIDVWCLVNLECSIYIELVSSLSGEMLSNGRALVGALHPCSSDLSRNMQLHKLCLDQTEDFHDCIAMGLLMDDIHTPTVPSGPTTPHRATNGVDKDKLSLMELIPEKTRVEEELSALGSVLDSVWFYYNVTLVLREADQPSSYSMA